MANNTYDIFISYSRHDIEKVRDITTFLQNNGYSVWIDLDGVECGDAFRGVIVNAIEKSSIFIFFSSKYSNESRWINKEISIAVDENKYIIPIKLDSTKYNPNIRFDLIDLDYIDLSKEGCLKSGKARLLKTITNRFEVDISLSKGLKDDNLDNNRPSDASLSILIDKFKSRNILVNFILMGICILSVLRLALSLISIINPWFALSSIMALLAILELSLNRRNGIMWWIMGAYSLQVTESILSGIHFPLIDIHELFWQPIALLLSLGFSLFLKSKGKTWWSICKPFTWYGIIGITIIITSLIIQITYSITNYNY